MSVIGRALTKTIWKKTEVAKRRKICATQKSLRKTMAKFVRAHLIRVRGFQYLPKKVSVLSPETLAQ